MKNLQVKFRLWIDNENGKTVLGDGRWRLLETIGKTGSLSRTCKKLNISYRKAWGDLAKMHQALRMPLIEKHRGGLNGGDTHLTDYGKNFINAYKKLHIEIEKDIKNKSSKYLRLVK